MNEISDERLLDGFQYLFICKFGQVVQSFELFFEIGNRLKEHIFAFVLSNALFWNGQLVYS